MPVSARLYISTVSLAGLACAFWTFHLTSVEVSPRFLLYLAIALASSGLKVRFPGLRGSISVNYVFTFLSMLEFKSPETLLLAQSSVVLQTFWHAEDKPRPVQLVFNLACLTVTVAASMFVYELPLFKGFSEGQLLRLSMAGIVYFFVNTMPVAVVIALTERRSMKVTCREVFDWSFSYYLIGVCLAEMVHLSIERIGWTFTLALVPVLYMVSRSYKLYMGKLQQEKKHVESTAALHVRTIEALAMAIEAKDECTSEHLRRVQVYSLRIAEELELTDDEKQALHAAAILHDIGKLAVPDYIIAKPGKLTPEEFDKMKVHTTVGGAILEQVGFPYAVAPIVRSHHEKWDGTGYPDGLQGEEIPIGARILAAVDCLDALASDRQYRAALPLDEAMEYVASLSGRSFDPKVISVLRRRYKEFESLANQSPIRKMLPEKDVPVERGESPDAGFQSGESNVLGANEGTQTFITSIASARHEVQTILEITQDLSGALRLQDTLLLVSERLKQLIPFDCIAVYVREGNVLHARYINGDAKRSFDPGEIQLGQGVSGWVAQNSKPILNGNPAQEPGYLQDGRGFSLQSALSVPFSGCSEHFIGAITLYHTQPNAYKKDHLRILLAVNDKISRAIESAVKFEQARREASTDELTGLPNARSLLLRLQDELARAESQNERLAIMVCDLDGFKHVNDSLGHLTGNELLKRVARIMEQNCRDSDYVGRMGGDEFVIMLRGIRRDELEAKLENMNRMVRAASVELCGIGTEVGISVGYAFFPEHGSDVETLLSRADKEMYAAKAHRKAARAKVVPLRRAGGIATIA